MDMSMSESEAKKVLDNIWDFAMPEDDDKGDVLEMAVSEAINALEEIQQYRAIGTVKVFETVIKSQMEYFNRMREYEKIGTVEEFRELKEKATAKEVKSRQCWKCEREECVPGCELNFNRCPNCNEVLDTDCGEQYKFCPDCGQQLLWT